MKTFTKEISKCIECPCCWNGCQCNNKDGQMDILDNMSICKECPLPDSVVALQNEQESVWLAWYHAGWTDEGRTLLAVCTSLKIAKSVLDSHKATRDHYCEYKDNATWVVEKVNLKKINE